MRRPLPAGEAGAVPDGAASPCGTCLPMWSRWSALYSTGELGEEEVPLFEPPWPEKFRSWTPLARTGGVGAGRSRPPGPLPGHGALPA